MVRPSMSIVMREQFLGGLIGAWSSLHDHVGQFPRLFRGETGANPRNYRRNNISRRCMRAVGVSTPW